VCFREAVYSGRHPIIPRLCVPEWKKDMANRKLILQVGSLNIYRQLANVYGVAQKLRCSHSESQRGVLHFGGIQRNACRAVSAASADILVSRRLKQFVLINTPN